MTINDIHMRNILISKSDEKIENDKKCAMRIRKLTLFYSLSHTMYQSNEMKYTTTVRLRTRIREHPGNIH